MYDEGYQRSKLSSPLKLYRDLVFFHCDVKVEEIITVGNCAENLL
jgi:hypothetical protein